MLNKTRRKPPLLTAHPTFWLMIAYPSLATTMFAVGFLNSIKAEYGVVLPSLLVEQFPVDTRALWDCP
jgi:hypothetical protein